MNVPEKAVLALGVKVIFTVYDAPGEIVTGRLFDPVMENVCPATVSCETSTALEPGLESVTVVVADCPTRTEPKFTELGETTRLPEFFALFAADIFTEYPHPETIKLRTRLQARRIKALPHQPLCIGCSELTRTPDESDCERSRHKKRSTASSESDGGGTQIRNTNHLCNKTFVPGADYED